MTIERAAGALEEVERAIEAARRAIDRRLASPGRIVPDFYRVLACRARVGR